VEVRGSELAHGAGEGAGARQPGADGVEVFFREGVGELLSRETELCRGVKGTDRCYKKRDST
jgi:hypothetical protein